MFQNPCMGQNEEYISCPHVHVGLPKQSPTLRGWDVHAKRGSNTQDDDQHYVESKSNPHSEHSIEDLRKPLLGKRRTKKPKAVAAYYERVHDGYGCVQEEDFTKASEELYACAYQWKDSQDGGDG